MRSRYTSPSFKWIGNTKIFGFKELSFRGLPRLHFLRKSCAGLIMDNSHLNNHPFPVLGSRPSSHGFAIASTIPSIIA